MLKWSKNELIYQIYPQSFFDTNADGVGDIRGISEKIEYLSWLGVSAIWICPMYDSPNRDNGYDVRDYTVFQQRYGTMDDFDMLVEKAHENGIKIVMDLVLNHTSNENPWFVESSSSCDNDKENWYIWRDAKTDGSAPTNWGAIFGGSAWTYCEKRKQYYLNTFSPYQPDLNWENPYLKKELFDIVEWWIKKGVDGFRLDAINFIGKDLYPLKDGEVLDNGFADIYPFVANKPQAHVYLRELRENIFEKYGTMTVGEASSATVDDALLFAKELDMIFQFEHIALDVDKDWTTRAVNIVELKKSFKKWQQGLWNKGWNALLWENHDQPRIVTRMGEENYLRERSAKCLAVCMYFMQGTPFVYQGQELGMINTRFYSKDELRDIEEMNAYHAYVDNGILSDEEFLKRISRRARDTSRTPMCWNDSKNAGFSNAEPWIKVGEKYCEINVEEQFARPDSCLHFYKKLFEVRKELVCVRDGAFKLVDETDNAVVAYYREFEHEKIAVVCNMTGKEVYYADVDKGEVLLGNVENSKFGDSGRLAPYEALVMRLK